MRKSNLETILLLIVTAILSSPAWPGEKIYYNRINFSVEASANVPSDTLVAVLYTQREGEKLSILSDQVNKTISSAISLSRKVQSVQVQTLDYRTNPVYKNQRLTGWRVRQSIKLESKNTERLSKLIGDLQATLAVQAITYQLSPELRSATEESLIARVIKAFNSRADQITRQMNKPGYRLINMDIRTSSSPITPVRMRSTMMLEQADVAPPTIEPGKQTIRLVASGSIELLVK